MGRGQIILLSLNAAQHHLSIFDERACVQDLIVNSKFITYTYIIYVKLTKSVN
jgi:hypothetical protein